MPIQVLKNVLGIGFNVIVTFLPVSRGYDAIMTVMDKPSKRPRYAPTHTNTDALKVAKRFFDVVMLITDF